MLTAAVMKAIRQGNIGVRDLSLYVFHVHADLAKLQMNQRKAFCAWYALQ